MITKAIDSVLAQTFQDLEIIVVDNYSVDNTESVVKSYKDKRIRYFKNQNNGIIAINRNYGIQESAGEYIAFLDDDDLWLPEKLEKQVKLLDADKRLGLVYSDTYVIDDKGNLIKKTYFHYNIKPSRGDVFNELLVVNFIPQLTVAVRREALDKVGLFDLKHKIAQDYDLWLRIAKCYLIDFAEQPLAKYRFYSGSTSQKNIVLSFREEIEVKERWLKKDQTLGKVVKDRIKRRKFLLYNGMVLISLSNIIRKHNAKSIRDFVDLLKYLVTGKT